MAPLSYCRVPCKKKNKKIKYCSRDAEFIPPFTNIMNRCDNYTVREHLKTAAARGPLPIG